MFSFWISGAIFFLIPTLFGLNFPSPEIPLYLVSFSSFLPLILLVLISLKRSTFQEAVYFIVKWIFLLGGICLFVVLTILFIKTKSYLLLGYFLLMVALIIGQLIGIRKFHKWAD
jgi:uncharacterized membrane protein YdcZ (DUF606 family)